MEDQRQMNASTSTCITCLPREILVKILTGLPAKSVVRLRCSCKLFYSYIPEPRFAFRILVLLPSRTRRSLLSLYSVSYYEESRHGRLLQADSAQHLDTQEGLVWSACSSFADGKMCLVSHETRADDLFDLSTGRCISLPRVPDRDHMTYFRRLFTFAVLGFDSSVSERYKVFKSVMYSDCGRLMNRQWVLTLEVDKSWREIQSTMTEYTDFAVHIHGIIYFIPYIACTTHITESKIAAMDVATESFIRFIPFPSEYQSPRERGWVPWMKLNGRLAFINFIIPAREDQENKIEIWRLERSMGWEWEKQTFLLPLEESEVIGQATSIGFATNSMGEIVFLLQNMTMSSPLILVYSFGRDVWRRFEIYGVSNYELPFSDMRGVIYVDDEIVTFFE